MPRAAAHKPPAMCPKKGPKSTRHPPKNTLKIPGNHSRISPKNGPKSAQKKNSEISGYALLDATGTNCSLFVDDCTFYGWVSWIVKDATFYGCTFVEGNYFNYENNIEAENNHWNSPLAIYSTTTFENCISRIKCIGLLRGVLHRMQPSL